MFSQAWDTCGLQLTIFTAHTTSSTKPHFDNMFHTVHVVFRVPPLSLYGEYPRGPYDNFQGEANNTCISFCTLQNLGLYACLVLPLKRTTAEWLKCLLPTSIKTSVKVQGQCILHNTLQHKSHFFFQRAVRNHILSRATNVAQPSQSVGRWSKQDTH